MKRNTIQKTVILETLRENAVHPTAEELFALVREKIPNISLATVYRNLRLLESEGKVLKITTDNGDRFDGHTHEHYHFTCTECKKVLDLELEKSVKINLLPHNFAGTVTGHELMFFGKCPECNAI